MPETPEFTPLSDDAWQADPDTWPYTPPLHVYERLEERDRNLYWRMGSGHAENLLGAAREEIDTLREQSVADEGAWGMAAAGFAVLARLDTLIAEHEGRPLTPPEQKVVDQFAALREDSTGTSSATWSLIGVDSDGSEYDYAHDEAMARHDLARGDVVVRLVRRTVFTIDHDATQEDR